MSMRAPVPADSELGIYKKRHITRHLGDRTYYADEVADIELDEFPDDREVVSVHVRHMRQMIGLVVHGHASGDPGVRVKLVRSNYPAERAGLRPGDLITHVDGMAAHGLDDFRAAVYNVSCSPRLLRYQPCVPRSFAC